MWPNSCLPSATALITAAQTGSEGRFQLEGVENHAARKFASFYLGDLSKSLHRLSTNPARMGKTPRREPHTRAHRERLPRTARPHTLRNIQAQMGIHVCIRRSWILQGVHHLPHVNLYSSRTSRLCRSMVLCLMLTPFSFGRTTAQVYHAIRSVHSNDFHPDVLYLFFDRDFVTRGTRLLVGMGGFATLTTNI